MVYGCGYCYKDKYGDNWEEELEAVIRRGNASRHALVCITEIIDHVISESKRMYAGTSCQDTFIIFHDGLKQWWEKEAQAYIREKGFGDRQLRAVGKTNEGTIYHNKVVGDSPEMCRTLDAQGFADHKLSMIFHTSLSSNERIVQDADDFEMVLDKITDEYLRHGRRARAANGKRGLKNKPFARQRTSTMVARPCHPDCEEARRLLKNPKALEQDAKALSLLMDADTDDEEDEVEKALREADEDGN
ncbi:hypothetical protein B484DRAFT_467833, partial [Ochromonadaceae sp. CCMP2298]